MARPLSLGLACSLLLVSLSGCGWHLRGADFMPADLRTLHISTRDPSSDFTEMLRRSIKAAGVKIPDNATDAQYALVILNEKSESRTASVNASARVSELQLTETVEFLILNHEGDTLIPATTVISERIFEYNENNVLATDDERALIISEMHRDLVHRIFNRFRQLKTAAKNAPPP